MSLAVLCFCALLLAVASQSHAGVLVGRTDWSGAVLVEDDVLVPAGSELVIAPGTRVRFTAAASTKTDPPYWNPDTELAVAGTLRVLGTSESPVVFEGAEGPWGGIVAAPGSRVELRGAEVRGAAEGLLCVAAACSLDSVQIDGGEYGLVLGPEAALQAEAVRIADCRVGVYDARNPGHGLTGVVVEDAEDAALLVSADVGPATVARETSAIAAAERVEYVGEYTVAVDQAWSGEIIVAGRVTVVPGAILTLLPGTRVAFRKIDSDGDWLGEGELLVLGGIRSRGEPARPVVFESAEPAPAAGDWDKVSLISSEDADNSFEHTVFRHGNQSLHAHFSSFSARSCLFQDNLRGVQFQESASAVLEGNTFLHNKQAIRFRDSKARVVRNTFLANLYGVHVFRSDLLFAENTLEGNSLGGFLAKECRLAFRGNRVLRGRDGARMKDPESRVEMTGNLFLESAEDSISLSGVEGLIEGNRFEGAGLDLVSLEDARATLRRNVFLQPGRHSLHLKGPTDVDASSNFWDAADIEATILDKNDDQDLGVVNWIPQLNSVPPLDVPSKSW